MNIIDMIGTDRNIIPYRPELRKIAGTINATILLQQMIYYCSGSKDNKFYKFRAPCSHENYRDGDSWTEKLGFSLDEFDSALSKIGFKLGNCKSKLSKEVALVHYYTDKQRYTWYSVNMEQLEKQLSSLYLVNGEIQDIKLNGESQDTKVNRESQITKKMGKAKLPCNLEKPNYPVNRETPITIHTEINYKEEIHKEENSRGGTFENKTSESFFQKEFEELKEYFSEHNTEKIILPSETENKVETENLSDFDFQSENTKQKKIKANNDNIPMGEISQIPFSEFWEKYQKKEGKSEAEKKWLKLKDKEREIIMQGLDNFVSRPDNEKENRKYQPMASTFLSQKRYLDDNYAEKQTLKSKTNGNPNYNPREWDEETGNFAFEYLFGKAR